MSPRLASRRIGRLSRLRDDEGMSLILVIGMVGIISLMAITTATVATNALKSSRNHTSFEASLATAEAGVDRLLAEIGLANAANPGAAYVSTGNCTVAAPTAANLASNDAERAWARDALTGLAAASQANGWGCVQTGSTGQYVSVRPPGKQAVYSMGWYPTYSTTAVRRLIKAEYIFAAFAPTNAILTDGDLDFSGSTAVTSSTTAPANIHTNADITGYNNSLIVSGAVSTTGTLPGPCPNAVTGGCTASAQQQVLPEISARKHYIALADANRDSWFDLCPGGVVKSPPPAPITATTVPCTGATLGSSGYNGWEYTAGSGLTPDRWTLPRTAGGPFPGVYYAYQADAKIGDNGNSSATWQMSVLAESRTGVTNSLTCDKLGGNIEWKLFHLTPKLPGLQLLADANLTGGANADAGSGLFFAGDKINLQTSSATLTGAVVASNACAAAGPNTIQGVRVVYDDTLELSINDVIRTALWLEYPSG